MQFDDAAPRTAHRARTSAQLARWVLPSVAGLVVTLALVQAVSPGTPAWSDLTLGAAALAMTVVAVTDRALRRALERHRRESERTAALFRGIVDNSSDVIAVVNHDGRLRLVSPSVEPVLGYRVEELADRGVAELIHPEDLETVVHAADDAESWRQGVELRLRHHDGSWRDVEVVGNEVADLDPPGYVVNVRDITHRKQLEAEIAFRAYHDPLTQLGNRTLLLDRLGHVIQRSARGGSRFGVVLLDLDDFKAVNENLGHEAGDRLLVTVAGRLRAKLRAGDTVARLGGDEFAVLLEDVDDTETTRALVERILDVLHTPVSVGDELVSVRASAGLVVTTAGEGDTTAQELLRNADIAMYAAKLAGKGRCELYDPGMRTTALDRLELRADLEEALDREELAVHFQPIIDLAGDEVVGMEALLRWHHHERGPVFPDQFIPLAEETRLIVPIGRWVLQEACRQAAGWQDLGPMKVSVNLSAVQLAHPELVDHVAEALESSGLPPELLALELTETALMHDTGHASQVMQRLKELGVSISVDDFGTGYASFGYLHRFPVDVLKVDRSFVDVLLEGPEEAAIAKAIVRLGHTLSLDVVAEGIEETRQADRLRSWGCRFGQGYLYSPPMPADVSRRWLETRRGEPQGEIAASATRSSS